MQVRRGGRYIGASSVYWFLGGATRDLRVMTRYTVTLIDLDYFKLTDRLTDICRTGTARHANKHVYLAKSHL